MHSVEITEFFLCLRVYVKSKLANICRALKNAAVLKH